MSDDTKSHSVPPNAGGNEEETALSGEVMNGRAAYYDWLKRKAEAENSSVAKMTSCTSTLYQRLSPMEQKCAGARHGGLARRGKGRQALAMAETTRKVFREVLGADGEREFEAMYNRKCSLIAVEDSAARAARRRAARRGLRHPGAARGAARLRA